MEADKKQRLETTIAALQDRWGARAIQRLNERGTSPLPHVSTGFPALDEALSIGGLPLGRISEIIGIPTSGMATIALYVTAKSQELGGTAVYIDTAHSFDPDYAARCGLNLSHLVLVRPRDVGQALAILTDFVLNGGINILVFDNPLALLAEPQPDQLWGATLGRLIAPLSQSNCALLFLTSLQAGKPFPPAEGKEADYYRAKYDEVHYPGDPTLPHFAAIRLFIQRERWIYRHKDIRGYQAQVLIIKNKLGPAGKQASIAITFSGVSDDDDTP